MDRLPRISCLLPTTNRLELFKRSVACWSRQTYPNKELVVVTNGSPEYRRQITTPLRRLRRRDVRFVPLDGDGWNLGQLRNQTLDHARGDIVCQWDDDDMYHPLRLECQAQALLKEGALSCYLTEQLQYFADRNELYWTNWNCQAGLELRFSVIPNTLMCLRSTAARYPESGPHCHCYEDMDFLDQLIAEGPVAALADRPYLYVYTYHGSNVYAFEHHWNIVHGWIRARPGDFLQARREALARELDRFDWPRPDVAVCGRDGLAFRYLPRGARWRNWWRACRDWPVFPQRFRPARAG